MYTPLAFQEKDKNQSRQIFDAHPFVTLLSFPKNELPFVNHLPVIRDHSRSEVLIGHMARRNPQWRHFRDNPNCMIIVNGPHTYVTPRWYRSGRDVPTWNYAAVHFFGEIEIVENYEEQLETLQKLTQFFEGPNGWEFELPADLLEPDALTGAIVSFRFHIERTEFKMKLSQNRPRSDRLGLIEGLAARADDNSREIRELMIAHEEGLRNQ